MTKYTGFALRDPTGYEWVDNDLRAKQHDKILNWSRSNGLSALTVPDGFDLYDPFEADAALFKRFARLPFGDGPEVRSAIVEFANEWGDIQAEPDGHGTLISLWNNYGNQIRSFDEVARAGFSAGDIDFNLKLLTSNLQLRYRTIREFGLLRSQTLVLGLFSCLAIQAAESLINQIEFADCKFCGAPISITESRDGKIFCSDSCRVQEYKRRKKTAIEMRKAGCKLRDISTATNTTIKQIKTWIGA
jgi:predicted nucleic acid-binding Zn ribbon protein